MRLTAFALVALFPFLALADDLPSSSRAPSDRAYTVIAQAAPAIPDAGKIGAAMGGDALPCGQAPAITNADIAGGVGENVMNDADAFADKLAELPARAKETVKALTATYPVGEDVIKRNYLVIACQRLKEKSVALETLKPALASLAEALGLPQPTAAEAVPNQPASDQLPAASAPSAQPSDRVAAAPPEPSASAAEPKAPDALPTAPPQTALPNAPTDIQPPSTPAEAAAPAPVARPEAIGQPSADTKVEQAPAGVPADPGAIAQKSEMPSSGQTGAGQPVVQGEPQPNAPGTEQPAAPETSTMSQGEAPGGPPPARGPEPLESSPGSVEDPAVMKTPAPTAGPAATAQSAAPSAQSPSPLDSAPPATPPAVAEAPAPAAPPSPPAVAEAPAPAAPPSPPAVAEAPAPAAPPSPPAVAEAPAPAVPPSPPAVAEAPAPAPQARSAAAPAPGQLSQDECRSVGVPNNCADLNRVLAQLVNKPLEYNHPGTMFLGRKAEIGLVLRTDWQGKDMPAEVSDEIRNLPGEVQQGLTKITRVMSAELSGGEFEVAPTGRQERTVVLPNPVSWNWQVKPGESGPGRALKLQLYAHIDGPNGTTSPILVKTLDTTIDVDVKTWDRVVAQIRNLEPTYTVIAIILGLLTVVLTYMFTRKPEGAGPRGGARRGGGGPVIGDLDQSGGQSKPSRGDDA